MEGASEGVGEGGGGKKRKEERRRKGEEEEGRAGSRMEALRESSWGNNK